MSKELEARFSAQDRYLTWVEFDELPEPRDTWLPFTRWWLVENKTDRVVVTIEGPTTKQVSFDVFHDNGQRKFLSLRGAQAFAVAIARETLHREAQKLIIAKVEEQQGHAAR